MILRYCVRRWAPLLANTELITLPVETEVFIVHHDNNLFFYEAVQGEHLYVVIHHPVIKLGDLIQISGYASTSSGKFEKVSCTLSANQKT